MLTFISFTQWWFLFFIGTERGKYYRPSISNQNAIFLRTITKNEEVRRVQLWLTSVHQEFFPLQASHNGVSLSFRLQRLLHFL